MHSRTVIMQIVKRGERMTEIETDKKRNGKKDDAWGEGYCPHAFMERFKCPRCGSVHFKSYPQAVPIDRSRMWTYEYVCAKCGQGMGLTMVGDDE